MSSVDWQCKVVFLLLLSLTCVAMLDGVAAGFVECTPLRLEEGSGFLLLMQSEDSWAFLEAMVRIFDRLGKVGSLG